MTNRSCGALTRSGVRLTVRAHSGEDYRLQSLQGWILIVSLFNISYSFQYYPMRSLFFNIHLLFIKKIGENPFFWTTLYLLKASKHMMSKRILLQQEQSNVPSNLSKIENKTEKNAFILAKCKVQQDKNK